MHKIIAEGEEEQIRVCRSTLRYHKDQIRSRVRHWQELYPAVLRALDYARQDISGTAERVVTLLEQYAAKGAPFSLADVRTLLQEGTDLISEARKLPAPGEEGSLWLALHGTIEQHIGLAAVGIDDILPNLPACIEKLHELPLPEAPDLAARLQKAVDRCHTDSICLLSMEALSEVLEEILTSVPEVANTRISSNAKLFNTRFFRVVIIDDEKTWREDVVAAITAVRDDLGDSFTFEIEEFETADSARKALVSKVPPTFAARKTSQEPIYQTIAVVDMGLPKDETHLKAIKLTKSTPDRNQGHLLLRDLRAYRANIPCIVLTTPSNLLEDQIRACEQGIEDIDYIVKGPGKLPNLINAILRICSQAQGHRIELWDSPRYIVHIDEVPIPLDKMPFRTLYALCQLSNQTSNALFTPEQILEQLDRTFGREYNYLSAPRNNWEAALVLAAVRGEHHWKAAWVRRAANVIHLWAHCKAARDGNLEAALLHFYHQYKPVIKDGLALLSHYSNTHSDHATSANSKGWLSDRHLFATVFDSVFGGLDLERAPDYDLDNIEKHIHEIRAAIHRAFQIVHRFVEPRDMIYHGMDGYRVIAEIFSDDNPVAAKIPYRQEQDTDDTLSTEEGEQEAEVNKPARVKGLPLSVLVVENETISRDRIVTLLGSVGFDVVAVTNVEAALQKLGDLLPDILCLDMHIPATQAAYEADPGSGDDHGGLDVLEQARTLIPDVKVMIPTTLYDQDTLRANAAQLHVPTTNFVPKGPDMEGHLLQTAARLRQEIHMHAVLPAFPPWRCPVIQVLPETDLPFGTLAMRVNGRPSSFRRLQCKLISYLLRNHGEEVAYEKLGEVIWGKAVSNNTRNQMINDVRQKIREQWLGQLPETHPEEDLLRTVTLEVRDKRGHPSQHPFGLCLTLKPRVCVIDTVMHQGRVIPEAVRVNGDIEIEVDGQISTFSKVRGKLIQYLLLHRGESISYDVLAQKVWGNGLTANARSKIISDLRQEIRCRWLRLEPESRREEALLETLRDQNGSAYGLILHAYVEDPHNLLQ